MYDTYRFRKFMYKVNCSYLGTKKKNIQLKLKNHK